MGRPKTLTDEQLKANRASYNKMWVLNNPEKVKRNNKRWRMNNPEKMKANRERWIKKNPERVRMWQTNNRERINERNRKRYKENPTIHNAYQKEWRRKLKIERPEMWAKHQATIAKYQIAHKEQARMHRKKRYWKWRNKVGYAPIRIGWNVIRKQVLERDNYICRICEKPTKEVHHLDGSGSNKLIKEQNNSLQNLIAACHKCHIRLEIRRLGTFSKDNKEKPIRNERIVRLATQEPKISQSQIARDEGLSRQRISQIVNRG